jgi:hypothetical protein
MNTKKTPCLVEEKFTIIVDNEIVKAQGKNVYQALCNTKSDHNDDIFFQQKNMQGKAESSNFNQYRYERKFIISELSRQEIEAHVRLHPAMFTEIHHSR